jgi:phage replication initiation protein
MKKSIQKASDVVVGGGSITPPIDTFFVEKSVLPKRVLIDWLSISFDFIQVHKLDYKVYSLDLYSHQLKDFLSFFGNYDPFNLPKGTPVNNYSECIQLGENIKILYGGEHTINSNGKYSLNLLMSGQACREFENFMDGSFKDLLSYMLSMKCSMKRIDLAIDDFEGKEITPYYIGPIVQNGYYTSPMEQFQIIHTAHKQKNETRLLNKGYAITFGVRGSNQFQIYDKRLERDVRGERDLDTDVWYRYEMRFVDSKAQAVAERYTSCVNEDDSSTFMQFTYECLYANLDLKIPSKSDSNVSRWKTDTKWLAFLDSVKKIKISTVHKIETSMLKKKLFFKRSYAKFTAEQLLYMGDEEYSKHLTDTLIDGLERIDEKRLSAINNGRLALGLQSLTMKEAKAKLKEYYDLSDYEKYGDTLDSTTTKENENENDSRS